VGLGRDIFLFRAG